MIAELRTYKIEELDEESLRAINEPEVIAQLEKYLAEYEGCFSKLQARYFQGFEKGILSQLERKSLEPIALHYMGERQVRGLQQFFSRSRGWDEGLQESYQKQLAEQLADDEGFMSLDESCFIKKGDASAGVGRQYCGRLGKIDNCQSGVFTSYASQKGYGLLNARLYLPQDWFGEGHAERRKQCQIPEGISFRTKNDIAREMVAEVMQQGRFPVKYLGCDAAFGSDHGFLDALPGGLTYFAAVRESEHIFVTMPEVTVPQNLPGKRGGRFKHPRASFGPVSVKTIASDDSTPWTRVILAEGTKGPIVTEVKGIRCYSARKVNQHLLPHEEIWLYIRRYDDGKTRYFLSNAPSDTDIDLLNRLATMRWSIEQCFEECKSYLGMTNYETRSYAAWHRHMLLVMVAHLFTIVFRNILKKRKFISQCLWQNVSSQLVC